MFGPTPQIPTPDYDDPKEVFAFFGLAFYQAAVLEHGVLNLTVAVLGKKLSALSFADVANLYSNFDKHTFGQVLNALKSKMGVPADLEASLEKALKHRNHLAHRFFVNHDIDFMSDTGRRKMIDELILILQHLQVVESTMDEVCLEAWEKLGITKEWLEQQMHAFIARAQAIHS